MKAVVPYISSRFVFRCPPQKKKMFTLKQKTEPPAFKYYTPKIIHNIPNLSILLYAIHGNALTAIHFSDKFNEGIKSPLPHSITCIEFGHSFNSIIAQKTLPPQLLTLKFGNKFNKPLSDLPATLTHLMFWEPFRYLNKTSWFLHDDTMLSLSLFDDILYYSKSHFNQSLDKVLPSSLTHLFLGNAFNHPLSNLPPSLTHLTLGNNFQQPQPIIPHLEWLVLGQTYSFSPSAASFFPSLKSLACTNPKLGDLSSLTTVITMAISAQKTRIIYPPNLQHLYITGDSLFDAENHLRDISTLTHLHLKVQYGPDGVLSVVSQGKELPPKITHLTFMNFNFEATFVVKGNTITWFCANFAPPSLLNEAPNITHLSYNPYSYDCISYLSFLTSSIVALPEKSKLKYAAILVWQYRHWEEASKRLPPSVTHLNLIGEGKFIRLNNLPPKLEYLGCILNSAPTSIDIANLPSTLHTIQFPLFYPFSPLSDLPSHVKVIPQYLRYKTEYQNFPKHFIVE